MKAGFLTADFADEKDSEKLICAICVIRVSKEMCGI